MWSQTCVCSSESQGRMHDPGVHQYTTKLRPDAVPRTRLAPTQHSRHPHDPLPPRVRGSNIAHGRLQEHRLELRMFTFPATTAWSELRCLRKY